MAHKMEAFGYLKLQHNDRIESIHNKIRKYKQKGILVKQIEEIKEQRKEEEANEKNLPWNVLFLKLGKRLMDLGKGIFFSR